MAGWSRVATLCALTASIAPGGAHGAGGFRGVGAQAGGVGDAYVAGYDGAESLFWNPAATTGRGVQTVAGYDVPFGMKELRRTVAAFRAGWGRVGTGGTWMDFGGALYRETEAGMVIGLRLHRALDVGVRIRHLRVAAEGTPGASWVVFDVGFQAGPPGRARVGATAWNAGGGRTKLVGQGGMAGVAVRAGPDIWLLGQVEKEAGRATGGGVGVRWRVASSLELRAGAGEQPERLSGGLGFRRGWLQVDYAALQHSLLGLTHRVSFAVNPLRHNEMERPFLDMP